MALSQEEIMAARQKYGIPSQGIGTGSMTPAGTAHAGSNWFAQAQQAWNPAPVAPPTPHLGEGAAGDFSENALRSVTAPLVRTGGLIEKGLDQTLGRVGNAIAGNGFTPTHSGEEAMHAADQIDENKVDSFAGKAGDVVGTVAPYLVGGEGSGVAKVAGNIAKNTAIGTAQTDSLKEGLETGIGGEILAAAGAPIKAIAKGAYKTLAIPMSKAEARLVQAYKANVPFSKRVATALKGDSAGPITADETAFRHGLMGTESGIGVQAKRASNNLWKEAIKPALDRTEVKVDMPKFFDTLKTNIIKKTPEPSRQKDLLEAVKALEEDYDGIGQVSLAKLQEFKKEWAKFVPQKAYQGKDIAGAFTDIKNEAAGEARKTIYDALGPDIKQAYIDHGNLQGLAEWGQTAMTGSKFKGGTGGLINAAKDAILTPIGTIGGQTLYKVGEGMQFIGPAGVRYLAELFNEESHP